MRLQLPKPIEIYLAAENAEDADALAMCFAPDAIVVDEGRTIEGLNAIKAWTLETKKKYQHTVEPTAIAERGGRTVVTARLAGNFPGSPIKVDFVFRLEGGKIAALEIH